MLRQESQGGAAAQDAPDMQNGALVSDGAGDGDADAQDAAGSERVPEISVIVPLYNALEHLEELMDSLLNQTFRDFEVVCVDDGSTDGTSEALAGYSERDGRVRVVRGSHAGAAQARNTGLSSSCGRHILFVDADDYLETYALEVLLKASAIVPGESGADIVLFIFDRFRELPEGRDYFDTEGVSIIDNSQVPVLEPFTLDSIRNCFTSISGHTVNKFYNASFLKGLNISFPDISAHEDMPFTCVAMASADSIVYLDAALYHYRQVEGQGVTSDSLNDYRPMVEALQVFRDELKARGLWARYEREFGNYAAHMLIWKMTCVKGRAAKNFDELLHESLMEEFGLLDKKADFYYKMENYCFLQDLLKETYESRVRRDVDGFVTYTMENYFIIVPYMAFKVARKAVTGLAALGKSAVGRCRRA